MVNLNLLPRRLRRRVGPDWWRTAAVAVPLLVLGVLGYLTLQAQSTLNALVEERNQLRAEVQILRPYVEEFRKLEARRKELEQIAAVARQVRATFQPWSEYLANFLRKLPRRGGRLTVSLSSINARPTDPARAQTIYGVPAQVEFTLRGEAASEQALIDFVRIFETDPGFGIDFQNASYDEQARLYSFTANVGMVVKPPEASEEGADEGAQ